MDNILSKIKSYDDFLNESTNSDNFPVLKNELLKYKNVDSTKLTNKLLKYVFLGLGSKDYFDMIFYYQKNNNVIKEKGQHIYNIIINKSYDVDIMLLLNEYIQQCIIYKKDTATETLKNYFYGYCECDVIGSKNLQTYYYDMLKVILQYLRTRIINDIGAIQGIKGIEGLKEFLENYKYNGVLYYTNETDLVKEAVDLFWKYFEESDGIQYIVPLITHFKKDYYKITTQYNDLIEDTLDTDLMEKNISIETNSLETVVTNILGYVNFISERMIEIDAQANDELVSNFYDKLIDDIDKGVKLTPTIKEFFLYVFGRLEKIYNIKKFINDNKNKTI